MKPKPKTDFGAGAYHNHQVMGTRKAAKHTPKKDKRRKDKLRQEVRRELSGE